MVCLMLLLFCNNNCFLVILSVWIASTQLESWTRTWAATTCRQYNCIVECRVLVVIERSYKFLQWYNISIIKCILCMLKFILIVIMVINLNEERKCARSDDSNKMWSQRGDSEHYRSSVELFSWWSRLKSYPLLLKKNCRAQN